ncbi:MAG: hypothetical protein IIC24_03235, partial [Chloroflexi bacterium]|nr:hypothetical protein [Chloroflexota bacterium]
MPEMSGAQALVRQLRSEGVDTIFALPGVQIMAAFDALHEAQNDISLIHVRHEQATTYMADGYAKATGRVGVAMAVPGPGALNASAGLGTAFASSSPVLLVSGQIDSRALGKRQGQLHEVEDQLDVFKPITKWNHRVTRVEEIPEAVHEAFRHLKTGRPRPVELEIPPDTLANLGATDIIEPEEYPRAAGSQSDIERTIESLNADPNVTGIMLNLPLPDEVDTPAVQYRIDPYKDVEGVNPANIGMLFYDCPIIAPCTALAVMEILKATGTELRGRHVVVVGQGAVVGRPITLSLMQQDATVTACNKYTPDLAACTRQADVLVVAAGVPGLIGGDHIQPGAVVIDVGVNRLSMQGAPG